LIFFWGRFGLPIPYRVPIVGVMSKPIVVPQKDDPSDEEVEHYHNILMEEMVKLFDKHKANYGWANKQLIIR
jgi:2-acylglycerol O-acyltransferase 2